MKDSETHAALSAWKRGEMPMFMRPSALSWPSQVPLLLDHVAVPVGVFNTNELTGDEFHLGGWADDL